MSEAVEWKVAPWDWPDVPEWWVEKLHTYFRAKHAVWPELQARRARRQEALMG